MDTTNPLFCPAGQFFVLAQTVSVHWLMPDAVRSYWDGMTIAEGTRNPEVSAREVRYSVFGVRDSLAALPVPSLAAALWYAESYEGPLRDAVRGLAACIVTGTPYGPDDSNPEGGCRVPATPPPEAPIAPQGAAFNLQTSSV